MKHKNVPATVTEVDTESGYFEAVVSVFGNTDLVGDVVMPGAFTDSLELWQASGSPIPVYWSHRMDDPTYNIGEVVDAREITGDDPLIPDSANESVKRHGGLYVKAKLDDHGLGSHVQHLMKTRRVKQFSFSYDVIRESKNKNTGVNELHTLLLHEVGPTPLGANPMTELLSAKAFRDLLLTPAELRELVGVGPPPDTTTDTKRAESPRRFFYATQADIALVQYALSD